MLLDNDEFARKIKPMHNVGIDENSRYRKNNERDWFYSVISTGYRYYLSNLNAAIGIEQFKKFYAFKERKQSIVRYYDEKLREIEGVVIPTHNWNETFPFSYVIRVLNKKRDVLMNYLKEKGVGTTVQFTPNHLQPAFADFHVPLPITEKLYEEILTLPLYFEMTDDDVETVIDAVRSFFY